MDRSTILAELEENLRSIDAALEVLGKLHRVDRGRRKRRVSAAARQKMSDAQKRRWAQFKKGKISA